MTNGLRKRWERGERQTSPVPGQKKGSQDVMRGKHGGPVIRQEVVLVIEPKGAKC